MDGPGRRADQGFDLMSGQARNAGAGLVIDPGAQRVLGVEDFGIDLQDQGFQMRAHGMGCGGIGLDGEFLVLEA